MALASDGEPGFSANARIDEDTSGRNCRRSGRHQFRGGTEFVRYRGYARTARAFGPVGVTAWRLEVLTSWWVIGASGALFAIEFFADKIPAFDLIWNALHTFIRVPVAALLAYRATATLSPWEQLVVTAAGGAIAFAAHGGKTAARTAVTASPEPFSNAALSLGEDGLAIFLTWFATRHPYSAAAIVAVLLLIIVLLARWVLRSLRALFRGAEEGCGNDF